MATVQDFLNNPKWVKRFDESFYQFDKDGDGYLTREDWLIFVDNLAKVVTDRPTEIAKLRAAATEFTNATGLTAGVKADKKKFVELAANMVVAEVTRVKRGEETLMGKLVNAMFDLLDTDRDGFITFNEYMVWIKATGFPEFEDAASAAFALLDKDKSGKIERKEYISSFYKFWFHLDDPEVQGMFGSKYE